MSAGAYGFTMSSNYNSRPRVAEVMVADDAHDLIRKRENIQDLFNTEAIIND
jgi:diaminopimelate decarboxylase